MTFNYHNLDQAIEYYEHKFGRQDPKLYELNKEYSAYAAQIKSLTKTPFSYSDYEKLNDAWADVSYNIAMADIHNEIRWRINCTFIFLDIDFFNHTVPINDFLGHSTSIDRLARESRVPINRTSGFDKDLERLNIKTLPNIYDHLKYIVNKSQE